MNAWSKVYDEVCEFVRPMGPNKRYFRGHCSADWELLPTLARLARGSRRLEDTSGLEENLYFDFVASAGDLLPAANDSWANLFAMQHHGLPTRLLDWSECFGVAVFFALRERDDNAAIWILNPYELNAPTFHKLWIPDVSDLPYGYDEYFILGRQQFPGDVIAVRPTRRQRRLLQQTAAFTLHNDITKPLNELRPHALRKILIPTEAREGAREFLEFAGITEYSLFQDLDGLSRAISARLSKYSDIIL